MNKFHITFSHGFRVRFAEKLMELANISIGALVFAPFISEKNFSILISILGIILAVICYSVSYIISN